MLILPLNILEMNAVLKLIFGRVGSYCTIFWMEKYISTIRSEMK